MNEENKLNLEQTNLLRRIVEDRYSCGAFSGMVTNLQFQHPDLTSMDIIKKALEIRLMMESLVKVSVPEVPKTIIHTRG